ncbi:uncharacterized protein LOC120418361 [Culex pipiens pallens]|uniref:uncharacterized protein LOC120418361 n=1 Tax=Culex pipiens pallens TaxID=42434 RepID=UPI001952A639|nr:uncharacterized protein LOC120418361 [Culex pipiens pallens]
MDTSEASAVADLLELLPLIAEVNRNILLYDDLCTALNGLLEHWHQVDDVREWKFAEVEASVELCQDQCRTTKEVYDTYVSKVIIFAGKHGSQNWEILLKQTEKTSEGIIKMCERMEEIKEEINEIGERVAAFGAVVFEHGEDFEVETWSDDEDYEAERDQPKRQRGQ